VGFFDLGASPWELRRALEMNLRIDDKIKLIPISLDYLAKIHESFTDEIIEFLPIEKLSKKIEDTTEFIERSIEQRNWKKGSFLRLKLGNLKFGRGIYQISS